MPQDMALAAPGMLILWKESWAVHRRADGRLRNRTKTCGESWSFSRNLLPGYSVTGKVLEEDLEFFHIGAVDARNEFPGFIGMFLHPHT